MDNLQEQELEICVLLLVLLLFQCVILDETFYLGVPKCYASVV